MKENVLFNVLGHLNVNTFSVIIKFALMQNNTLTCSVVAAVGADVRLEGLLFTGHVLCLKSCTYVHSK